MLLKYVIKTIDFSISFCNQLSFKMSTSPFGPTFITYTHLQPTSFLSTKSQVLLRSRTSMSQFAKFLINTSSDDNQKRRGENMKER